MSKEQSLGDIAATLLASVSTVTVTDTDVVERIKDAEAAMRALPMTIDDIDGHAVVRHEYTPSKTLPTVEIVCEALMSLAQVRGIERTTEAGKIVTIVGLRPDADYALYLCQLVDKAVCTAWAAHAETDVVKSMLNREKSTYRRAFQRKVCGEIRSHVTALTADRFIQMKAGDRMVLAKKRDVVAGSALEVAA